MVQKNWSHRTERTFLYSLAVFVLFFCHYFASSAYSNELTTAFQESYPKYYWSDPEKKERVEGLCIDIIKAIEKSAAITINAPNGFLPFKRLQSKLANGDIEIFVGMAKNTARLEQYIFIDTPLYEVNHIIAARKDDPAVINSFDDIRGLAPDNIILTNLGTATEHLLKAQKGLTVDADGTSLKENLKKLIYGRGRFICFHDIGLIAAIKRYGYKEQIKVFPSSFKKYYHYIAFAPTTPKETIARIDKAVQELAANGELERIRSRYVH